MVFFLSDGSNGQSAVRQAIQLADRSCLNFRETFYPRFCILHKDCPEQVL